MLSKPIFISYWSPEDVSGPIGCIIGLSQGPKNVLLRCDCGREIYIWYCSWEPSHEGGETTKVQTRIGPSLIKRDSRSAWLALIDSAKILTITTGARSWLLPLKVTASSKGCYYILLSTVQTPYCTVQLYRVSLPTVDFTVFLLAPRASPHHCQNVCTRCHT